MTIIAISSGLVLLYSILLLYYRVLWDLVPRSTTDDTVLSKMRISILIPARNEEENIGRLLSSIQKQSYPNKYYEVIVIDDFSEDKTAEIVANYEGVRYLHLEELIESGFENSFKKRAITEAIKRAEGDLIVTTDADCEVGPNWLKSIVQTVDENNYKAVAGPVMFFKKDSIINIFQELDFIAMQGITSAVLTSKKGAMCNGANFAYTKKAFEEVGGYMGIDHLASGDDMMLMHKFSKSFPDRIGYIKNSDAIVLTSAMGRLNDFLQQRIRWASKNKSLSDRKIQAVLLLSWLMNGTIIAAFASVIYQPDNLLLAVLLLIIKGIAEYFFCYDVARFFERSGRLPYLFILQPLHVLYMTLVGFLGMFNTYTWKNRKVK